MASKTARTPTARLIDASVHCSLCGVEGYLKCDCWVTIRCPTCERTQLTERAPADGNVKVIEDECPKCAGDEE